MPRPRKGSCSREAASNESFTICDLGVLGVLNSLLGNLEAAAGLLRDLPERLLVAGLNDAVNPVWSDAIEALVAVVTLRPVAPISSTTTRTRGGSEVRWR